MKVRFAITVSAGAALPEAITMPFVVPGCSVSVCEPEVSAARTGRSLVPVTRTVTVCWLVLFPSDKVTT
ncbi:hypothetical protein AFCDBAGC_3898 [Methylobacterium cerastii]|uniref:Secreted protein n=1 Tax=Methylobacterium cerastii TaxID=932741 RepID=A0ABQ4QL97_9HYPH|nr:hypothetical protein AFCDBAGC_3898 [Methylobacterium cerastii]